MSPLRFALLLPVVVFVLVASAVARESAAAPFAVGEKFPGFSTRDQHDRPYAWAGGARLVVVAFEMDTGKAANAFLEQQGADYLARRQAIFLSNIHGMPGIARTFALPKMRKYPHRILLADGEHFLDRYPRQENHLTALELDAAGAITAIRFVPKAEAARAFAPR
jgi:hypothetical protein